MVNIPGFGSFGFGGGSFGGPVAAARARDPRYAYAQALLRNAGDTSPIESPWQGISRLGQGAIAGLLYGNAESKWNAEQEKMAKAYAEALGAMQGKPAVTEDQTMYGGELKTLSPAVKPDMNRAVQIMGANPYLAPQAMQLQQEEARYQRGRADQQADTAQSQQFTLQRDRVQNEFTAAQGELTRAQQKALQEDSQQNQAALQAAQQRFTAAQNAAQQLFESGQTQLKISATAGQQVREGEDKLRDDFNALKPVQAYREVVPIYNSMIDAAPKNTRASDLNLVYGLAKIFDPTSVVREGEMVLVKNTASIPEWLQGEIARVNGGAGLLPATRQGIMAEAASRVNNIKSQYDLIESQFGDIAARRGYERKNIIVTPGAVGTPQAAPKVGDVLDGHTFLGGNPADPKSWKPI